MKFNAKAQSRKEERERKSLYFEPVFFDADEAD
jgi:hypothetical protein